MSLSKKIDLLMDFAVGVYLSESPFKMVYFGKGGRGGGGEPERRLEGQ